MQVAISPNDLMIQPAIGERPHVQRHPEPGTGIGSAHLRAILGEAVTTLSALFEQGCAAANVAMTLQDRPGSIDGQRYGLEHRYSAAEPATDMRFISLFICVPATDGHLFGGAYINTSRTPPSIYLVPHILDGVGCWTVSATGTPFTAQVVRDLFASVFGDDVAAGGRIAPLVGYDLFQTPWS